MSITATTLSGAVASTDTVVNVAAATNITGPTPNTGAGITYLKIDDEMMLVSQSPTGTAVPVIRGVLGTQAKAHETSAPVLAGSPTDFKNFVPVQAASAPSLPYGFSPLGAPLTGATIAPKYGFIHHYTGSTQLATITVPDGTVAGGKFSLIFDGSGSGLSWSAGGNIAVAGTVSQYQTVDFYYDPVAAKWYPSTIT